MGLSVFSLKEGWQGKAMDWVHFYSAEEICTRVCARIYWSTLAKRPHLEAGNEAHPSGKVVSPPVLPMQGGKGSEEVGTSDVSES